MMLWTKAENDTYIVQVTMADEQRLYYQSVFEMLGAGLERATSI